ncbi:tyrosine-protein phosphatase [Embleya sp. NPDC050154]|uniref:tyrosine-protein phosphatase n=1 Tax=unclassified Embleya TaxID=2699296 RepID=UPI003790B6AC
MRRHIPFRRLHNFRDLGGYAAADGRTVAWGRLYRSDSLGNLGGDDAEQFFALGVRTVVDLRYPHEADRHGRIPAHASFVYHNVCTEHRPWDQASLGPDTDVARFLADRYAELALDGVAQIREVLDILAAADAPPAVFHCAAGKDRTGVIAALVLALLGVDEEDIVADYVLTELARDRLVADRRADHPDRPITWPGWGRAPEAAMRLFLAENAAAYGSLTRYAAERLGVDHALVEALHHRYLAG